MNKKITIQCIKSYFVAAVSAVLVIVMFAGCAKAGKTKTQSDPGGVLPSVPVYEVDQAVWESTFSDIGLSRLLTSYTVTNSYDWGRWDTCVTADTFSRLSFTNEGELQAGAILANGEGVALQYSYSKQNGWIKGVYDEVDRVEEFVAFQTQDLIETLLLLSDEFGDAIWNAEEKAYAVNAQKPYSGPAMADSSQEKPTSLTFKVYFVDGVLLKVVIIEGENRTVIHSFGTTQPAQIPEV